MPPAQPTVVVGGGISGLSLALSLHRAGVPVTVLEAADTPGGAMCTVEREGFLLEAGPNSVLDRDGAVAALATSLGLSLRPASERARQRAVVLGGRLRTLPSTPSAWLTSDVLPFHAKLRLLLEPFSRRARPGVDESLGDFARRHLGRTVTATLVDALQTGIWAGDMERLSAASAFPRLWALERGHRSLLLGALLGRRAERGATRPLSLAGGVGALCLAAAGALRERVWLKAKVTALQRVGDGWTLATARGPVAAPRVVLALPPSEASELARPLDQGLADTLASFPTVPVAVVHLGFRPALKPEPEGIGFLVPHGEGRNILGTLYASSLFPFRAQGGGTLLTVLLGGAHRGELLALDDAALLQTARKELAALLGVQQAPVLTHVFRWPRAIPQYNVGHQDLLHSVRAQAARWPGLWLTGNAYTGAGVADCIRAATELSQRLLAD
jgi:protoporphyrinogen/coproporphyrinogen III oxidase